MHKGVLLCAASVIGDLIHTSSQSINDLIPVVQFITLLVGLYYMVKGQRSKPTNKPE